jgi:hypothetical protein
MTNTAIQLEKFKTLDKMLPARGQNIYHSGLKDKDSGFVKYGPKSSDQPTLLIPEALYDQDRNVIPAGYYELLLSEDRQTLLLAQSDKIIAVIPVFKVEEDHNQEKIAQPMDNKSQKKFDKEQKKQAKKNKKLIAEGKMLEEPEIYNNATIDYNENGDYYLIKYERGKVRAWGTIKF